MRKTLWMKVYEQLRERIMDGTYPPGNEFPTNIELIKEFEVSSSTVQTAVNALIRDGLVFSSGSNPNRRRVRPLPYRSSRKGDFLEEHGDPGKEVLVDIKIIYEEEDLPIELQTTFDAPVLYYHTHQFRDDILIASTESYIPNVCDLKALREMLKDGGMIYNCMKELGANPVDCQENLIAALPNEAERAALDLPSHANIPIVRLVRKAFEPDGRLVQVCFMVDRADCYEFEYKFPLF
jgi:GntR family transcriptional regulator